MRCSAPTAGSASRNWSPNIARCALRCYGCGRIARCRGEPAEEVTRFNEAIDEAIAESVSHFAEEVERWRNIFLGVLGHDLRSPLGAIVMTSE